MSKLFNYSKPGKGVSKNEKEKNALGIYFEILWEKLWQICILNLLLFAFMIPFAALSVGVYFLTGNISAFASTDNIQLHIIVSLFPFAFIGPFISAGFRIVRDFARREPVFIFTDFFQTLKKNVGQSLFVSIFNYFVFSALSFALPGYFLMESKARFILFPLTMLCTVIVLFMNYYMYLMVITLDLSIRQILKNAFIFAFISFGKNLIITLCLAIVFALTLVLIILGVNLTFLLGIIVMLWTCFFVGFIMFSISYFAFPEIKKYAIDPYYEAHPDETSESLESENSESSEEPQSEKTVPLSEYVYHNGKMVHRSYFDNEAVFDDDVKSVEKDQNND